MSGIAGIYHLDRKPADAQELGSMLEALAHRGGDGKGSWVDDNVAIGHVLRHTTPESLREDQPIVDRAANVVLTADARVDNRADLIAALGTHRVSATSTDSELVMAAYLEWGEAFPLHVVGAFAVVVWDAREHKLVCVRDALGLRPLYYVHKPGCLFAFASEIKALLALSSVSRDVDEVRVADYIMMVEEEADRTFYSDVKSLRPAETLTVSPRGAKSAIHWQLDPEKEMRLASSMEYADAFHELFAKAVRCRMRSAFPLGTMLSGGLDSSSITAMARHLGGANQDLTTLSFLFDQFPACDEREYMGAIWSGGGLKSIRVDGGTLGAFDDVDKVLWHADEPHIAVNLFLHWAAWEKAQQAGIRVVLDGFFGDSTISFGDAWATELFKAGHWLRWLKVVNSMAGHDGHESRRARLAYARDSLDPLIPAFIRARASRFGFEDYERQWKVQSEVLRPVLRERVQLFDRLRNLNLLPRSRFVSARHEHFKDITSPAYANGFATLNKTAAAFGIEVWMPFADSRLLSFCLAIPRDQVLMDGESRSILRRGLGELLPPIIRERKDKADLSRNFERAVAVLGRGDIDTMLRDESGALAQFLDLDVLGKRLIDETGAARPSSSQVAWFAVVLSRWLEMAS